MRRRYIIFIAITTLFNIFFFYYIIVFCGIYPHTSSGWAISTMYCLVFKLIIAEVVGALSGGLVRRLDPDGGR
jgi:hypothetical protein